jgi:hypothetical protein
MTVFCLTVDNATGERIVRIVGVYAFVNMVKDDGAVRFARRGVKRVKQFANTILGGPSANYVRVLRFANMRK